MYFKQNKNQEEEISANINAPLTMQCNVETQYHAKTHKWDVDALNYLYLGE